MKFILNSYWKEGKFKYYIEWDDYSPRKLVLDPSSQYLWPYAPPRSPCITSWETRPLGPGSTPERDLLLEFLREMGGGQGVSVTPARESITDSSSQNTPWPTNITAMDYNTHASCSKSHSQQPDFIYTHLFTNTPHTQIQTFKHSLRSKHSVWFLGEATA